jgi:hypothetical protein
MPNLHTVYDFANESKHLTFLFPIPFVIIGLVVLIYHINLQKEQDGVHGPFNPIFPGAENTGINTKFKGILLGSVFILVGCVLIPILYWGQSPMFEFYKKICREKSYMSVQGRIREFHHSESPYHDTERFNVNDVHFEFRDYSSDGFGYSTGTLPNDPLRANLFVRISYFDDGTRNVILKLETE